jgi:hypothetical protein
MTAWVKCTDSQERTIFLNLDAAISMVPLQRTGLTRIAFTGAEKDTVEVKETPDYLIKTLNRSRRLYNGEKADQEIEAHG